MAGRLPATICPCRGPAVRCLGEGRTLPGLLPPSRQRQPDRSAMKPRGGAGGPADCQCSGRRPACQSRQSPRQGTASTTSRRPVTLRRHRQGPANLSGDGARRRRRQPRSGSGAARGPGDGARRRRRHGKRRSPSERARQPRSVAAARPGAARRSAAAVRCPSPAAAWAVSPVGRGRLPAGSRNRTRWHMRVRQRLAAEAGRSGRPSPSRWPGSATARACAPILGDRAVGQLPGLVAAGAGVLTRKVPARHAVGLPGCLAALARARGPAPSPTRRPGSSRRWPPPPTAWAPRP